MGLVIGEKNIVLEKKLKGVYIQRTNNLEKIYITIKGSKGFYDENRKWNEISEFDVVLKEDEILLLWGLSSTKLGTNKLGEMIYRAAYGILSGAIPLSCTLTVLSNVDGIVNIYKEGTNIYQIPTNRPFELPILVNVTVSVESPGYKAYTTTIPVLQGEVTLNVTLEPEEPEVVEAPEVAEEAEEAEENGAAEETEEGDANTSNDTPDSEEDTTSSDEESEEEAST